MESARRLCSRALIEVARVLVQKGWQDGAAHHDVSNVVRIGGAKALTVTLRTLPVVGDVSCLVDGGKRSYPDDSNWIERDLGGEPELQLRGERLGVAIIDDVEIGEDAENALLLLDPDLLGGDLLRGSNRRSHSDVGKRLCDLESGARQDGVLAWLEDDSGGRPVCKSLGADGHVVGGSRLEILEFKESIVVRDYRAGISEGRTFENDGGAWNCVVVHIDYSANNNSWRRLGRVRQKHQLLLSLGRPCSERP